jgi:hypothetical protein
MQKTGFGSKPGLHQNFSPVRPSANDQLFWLAPGPRLWQHPRMASQKKLTRADVYKQIDAFRGVVKQTPGDKPSVEQWAETKRAEKESGERKFSRPAVLSRQA